MDMAIVSAGTKFAGLAAERLPGAPKTPSAASRVSPAILKSAAGDKPADRRIVDVTKNLEQISLSFDRRLQFVVDHQSNEVTIKVIDRETDKVIKVLPPEELQRLHSRIEETIGFLLDKTV
ncbi:MAG: flagellar protein FlaG [Treponema sp.]|nr:flagellar protein FlaG [Treponema sp.]